MAVFKGYMILLSGFILEICIFKAAARTLILSVPSVTEGSPLTLTCQYSEAGRYLTWLRQSSSTAPQHRIGSIYSPNNTYCATEWSVPVPYATLYRYSYSCDNTSMHTLTVWDVTSSYHGEIWQCGVYPDALRDLFSNYGTISVKVQVTSVALSPSTDATTVIVSQPASFECTVPRSLPSATIVWYRNSSGVISFAWQSTSYNYSSNSDRTERTIGGLTFSPNKTDNEVGLNCTASSGGASRMSRQIMLNVQ